MNDLRNLYRSFLIVIGLVRFQKSKPKNVQEVNETYPGLHNEETPLKVFYPHHPSNHTLILYPGASPFAEEHPGMITVGNSMASAGFLVFIPRIPPLKKLDLSEEIVDWMIVFYKWLQSRNDVNPGHVTLIGMSFGGAFLLKASLDKRLQMHPPKSILVYGTYFDIETALRYLLTGKIDVENKEIYIKPNEWGLIVLFHNFLPRVNVGYDTKNVQRILKLRVKDRLEEVEVETKKLTGQERDLLDAILNAQANTEILRITDLFWKQCGRELESASPRSWCDQIKTKVFILHGANDSMCPFTESVKLADALENSRLLISYLYGHREMSGNRGILFRLKEFLRIIFFMLEFIQYKK